MEHIDIDLSEPSSEGHPSQASILILTDEGELIEMQAAAEPASVAKAISSRPPATITLSGGAETDEMLNALTSLGHDVAFASTIETIAPPPSH